MNIQLSGLTPFSAAKTNDSSIPANQTGADSFQSELTAAVTATLQKFGVDPSKISITIGPANNTAAPPNVTPPSNLTSAAPPPLDNTDSLRLRERQQHWYANDPVDDAYWAKQPEPVQQLREIDDPDQRQALATQLAAAGYTIDYPIMVMGWDAGKTMALRHSYGYTWVPSALQDPIELAPGLPGFGTLQTYDPNNGPAGSIPV